jgi:transposase
MVERPAACPVCGGAALIRSGHACGRQRWRCKGCGRQVTRTTPRGKPAATKREAVGLYCTGLSLSATGRRLGVSAQSVMRWVRDHARLHCPKPAPTGRATVVETDEVWHFVQKRPASSGSGRRSSRARDRPPDRLGMRRPRPGHARAPAGPPGALGRAAVLHRRRGAL